MIKKVDDLAATIAVLILVIAAIVWVLVQPERWTSCVVLVMAAIPLAILGRESK